MTFFAGALDNHRRESPINIVRRASFPATATMLSDTGDALQALRVAFASSPSGMAVCNQSGHIVLANHAIAAVFGFAPEEPFDRDFGVLVPDLASGGWTDGVLEASGVRKDGSPVPVKVNIATIRGREPLFIASVIDLTNQRRLEARASATESFERFQALMSDLATRLAAASAARIDGILHEVIDDIADALDVDRCVAYLPADRDGSSATSAWAWARPGYQLPEQDFNALESFPWTMAKARDGKAVCAVTLVDLASRADRESMHRLGARSCAGVPLNVDNTRGALIVDARAERPWPREVIDRLSLLAAIMGQAFARTRERARLDPGVGAMKRHSEQAGGENAMPWRKPAVHADQAIVSDSVAIRRVLAQVDQVAPTGATVLLLGETGVGKEVFAEAIHNLSPRHHRAMIRVSCAAIPIALIESELFGRERGAFTGALSRQIGRFEAAHGTTIFLDEIGDLPLEIQVKLLRVLQARTIERLGGNQSIKVDVRVIAATNKNLEQAVADRTFREDLYYRLNVFPITIPPLRDRIDDIPSLVWTFVDEFSQAFGKKISSISKESLAALQRYSWPGNVRELRNVIEREMIIATGPTLVLAAPRPQAGRAASLTLVDSQVEHITSVLDSCGWRVRGAGGAAERLGVKPTTLESRMARLGIARGHENRAV